MIWIAKGYPLKSGRELWWKQKEMNWGNSKYLDSIIYFYALSRFFRMYVMILLHYAAPVLRPELFDEGFENHIWVIWCFWGRIILHIGPVPMSSVFSSPEKCPEGFLEFIECLPLWFSLFALTNVAPLLLCGLGCIGTGVMFCKIHTHTLQLLVWFFLLYNLFASALRGCFCACDHLRGTIASLTCTYAWWTCLRMIDTTIPIVIVTSYMKINGYTKRLVVQCECQSRLRKKG